MVKRYAVSLIVGYTCFYGDCTAQYEHVFFDTLEEAQAFRNEHHPNCTDVFDLENLPF